MRKLQLNDKVTIAVILSLNLILGANFHLAQAQPMEDKVSNILSTYLEPRGYELSAYYFEGSKLVIEAVPSSSTSSSSSSPPSAAADNTTDIHRVVIYYTTNSTEIDEKMLDLQLFLTELASE